MFLLLVEGGITTGRCSRWLALASSALTRSFSTSGLSFTGDEQDDDDET